MSVEINGKQYFVKIKRDVQSLNLSKKGISSIMDIKGLESLVDLKILDLMGNNLKEIKGLEPLIRLEKLYLSSNQIEILRGLDTLKNLKFLDLSDNLISDVESFNVSVPANQFYLLGNPIMKVIRDIYGLFTIQNLKDYSTRSKEEIEKLTEQKNKKKYFIGYQFPIKEPKIMKKSHCNIIFSMRGEKFELNLCGWGNDRIFPEIEKFLISMTSSEN